MTTLVKIAIALIIALFLSSCGFDIQIGDFGSGEKGNGNVVTETRPITQDFTKISAAEGLQVYVTQADEFMIKVEADDNIIDLIRTDIEAGKLRIHAEKNIGRATKKIMVFLPEISALTASSGAQLKSENALKTNDLMVDGSSGANLSLELTAQELEIDASSGAHLEIEGEADNAVIDVSSGGQIDAKNLVTNTCMADASSGGNMQIFVNKSLEAEASSGGHISYTGDANVKHNKMVSGSISNY